MMYPTIDHSLPRTSPEQQGIASSAILQFAQALESQIRETHSFMLLRHGSVIAEGWWSPYAPETPHMVFSVSKSVTSTAVGLAMDEGYFSIDDLVISFFPDDTPAEVNAYLATMTVRHLLTMSSGHEVDTLLYMDGRSDGRWIKAFLEAPLPYAPGTQFVYNTGATYILAAIVQKTTGQKLIDYLQPRLFEPLGISNAAWQESPEGIAAGGYGLIIRTEDIARFGQLYLQNGMYQGQQILPEGWVEEATAYQIANGDEDPYRRDWTQGYGYQFWRSSHGAYRADGVFGQFCIIMPEQDAVLAITAGTDLFDGQQVLNLVWGLLLPAMQPDALLEDLAAHNALIEKLSSLSWLPSDAHKRSPLMTQVSGRRYLVDANRWGLEAITLTFSETGCSISVSIAAAEESFPCGFDAWHYGETTLFNDSRWLSDEPSRVAISSTWTTDETLKMTVRLVETPFYFTLMFHFIGDELMIESQVNVSMESIKPLLLTARQAEMAV